ncbi:RIMS-binding protein 2-like isoform X1 [Cololabis saira]|uniref:RIMS-binding protein 2-like isoform X1 n=1 Tax=Cololabis saira TaxID=129043 RepID=UPI002AD50C79|nr:RIMS-binding protein 2-like isoform X1 [Cololabis saira]
METRLELDVLIYPDEVRVVTPEALREWELETASQLSIPDLRLFVALYPYNPAAMSPNYEAAAEELPFVPGQIIKVFGDKDADGFYHGESGGLSGYVPSNMVAEIPVGDDYLKDLLMQQGFIPVDHTVASDSTGIPDDVVVQRMVALFDYDPWESSPNVDSDAELGFRSGDIIYVLGRSSWSTRFGSIKLPAAVTLELDEPAVLARLLQMPREF